MNILLVSPKFPDTFWSFKYALKFIRKKASLPPLGLLTVAAILPPEWNKKLVDMNVQRLLDKDIAWADYVFISAMIVQREISRDIIRRCRNAGVKVVAGGPLFTIEHEHFPDVDHFILNEAELTLPTFLADLKEGRPKRVYSTPEFFDIHQTPSPLWQLADLKRYATMSIQYSRGCPFNCDFCNVTALLGHQVRVKTTAQIIAELDSLYTSGWRGNVFFVDDNFIGNKKLLKLELLPALTKWREYRKSMTFNTEASINLADDEELMDLMFKAGFDEVFIGIETPDETSLAECSKKQNRNRDLIADVKRIQRAGIQVQGGFIVGFDSDKPSIFQRQIEFIQKSGIVTAMVGLLQAPPGTRLYERLKKEGRLVGKSTGDNVDGTTNIIPCMSLDKLKDGYHRILQHIYSPRNYYQRMRTFLREYKPPEHKPKIRWADFMAFMRSILHLGILGRERFQYWKFIFWVNFVRPKLFSLGVTLAIYGHHFRKICQQHLRERKHAS
jgi:radical SAM superfamily enzyme YgiQ (UPF0313 family)